MRETYGYDVMMMYVEEPIDGYPSIYQDEDFASNISSVAESAVLCNGSPS